MSAGTLPVRRRTAQAVAVVLAAALLSGCVGTWGIRNSYRNYVNGPIANGAIETSGHVEWLDGAGNAGGPFEWAVHWSELDLATGSGTIQFRGGITTKGHSTTNGSVLDASWWNPRLEFSGDQGTIYADLTFRRFAGTSPEDIQPIESRLDVPFATVDLSGQDLTPGPGGWSTIENAPAIGVPETMELIGWDQFYGHELPAIQLDPISVHFSPGFGGNDLHLWPEINVSRTDDLRAGDQIIVWGRGIDPTVDLGSRPPLSGQPSGAYVIFGKFAEVWQPSAGAPSSARNVVEQKWALPAARRAIMDPTGIDETFVTLEPNGTFKAILTITESDAPGNYGVYAYPGSGAVNPDHEFAVLLDVTPAPAL